MDSQTSAQFSDSIVITGKGSFWEKPGQAATDRNNEEFKQLTKILKHPKMKKFMGKQDKMAVLAAKKVIQNAKIPPESLKMQTGLFLSVGYIPFERTDIEPLATHSNQNGKFEMELFSTEGISHVNPLLTFRCLPNMPIFHVSLNFEIQGNYFITHPGIGQFYVALEQAITALKEKEIQFALVGGVADQNNFLVQHHFQRLFPENQENLADAAGFICLELKSHAIARKAKLFLELAQLEIKYQAHDPFKTTFTYSEKIQSEAQQLKDNDAGYYGPGSFVILLEKWFQDQSTWTHQVETLDGFKNYSNWVKPTEQTKES